MTSPTNSAGVTATWLINAWCYAAAFALLVVCALPNIYFPFVADQAAAISGARTLLEGGTLYVEFWDNKMPGLIWFYYAACRTLGCSEAGVHTLELVWMLFFALVLLVTMRRYVIYPWLTALAPIVVIGTYYVSVEPISLTQLEMLVALPIFLSAWSTDRGLKHARLSAWMFFASGVFAGITVVFKLVFAPLFIAFWLLASFHAIRFNAHSVKSVFARMWAPFTAGVVGVVGLVAIKFWFDDALDELLWTAFVYPPLALEQAPPAFLSRIVESTLIFAAYFAAWLVFVGIAIVQWWRRERTFFTSLLLVWLVVGLGIIFIQRFSWWSYHFLTLFTPIGLLGVRGFAEFLRLLTCEQDPSRFNVRTLALVLCLPLVGSLAVPAMQKYVPYMQVIVREGGTPADLRRIISNDYAQIQKSVRFLRDKAAQPGPIYVFGNPLFYHHSGRRPALPIIGWPWGYFLQRQWEKLPRQLEDAKPNYIYIDKTNDEIIDARGAGVREFITERYLSLLKDGNGVWMILKPAYR